MNTVANFDQTTFTTSSAIDTDALLLDLRALTLLEFTAISGGEITANFL